MYTVAVKYPAIDYYGQGKSFQAIRHRLYFDIFQRSMVEIVLLAVYKTGERCILLQLIRKDKGRRPEEKTGCINAVSFQSKFPFL